MGLHKILKWVALGLAIIGALFVVLLMSGNDAMIDNMLYIAYIVLALILVIVLIFVLKGLLAGNIKKTLMSVGLFLAVVIVSYLISSGSDLNLEPFADQGVTESTSKNIGMGLYTFYILAIVAVASMALSGLKKIMK